MMCVWGGILFGNADSWTSPLDVMIQIGQDWGCLRIPRAILTTTGLGNLGVCALDTLGRTVDSCEVLPLSGTFKSSCCG